MLDLCAACLDDAPDQLVEVHIGTVKKVGEFSLLGTIFGKVGELTGKAEMKCFPNFLMGLFETTVTEANSVCFTKHFSTMREISASPSLFGESINWALIAEHYDDLLRVCVSIQAGRIYPSSILKRLGSAGRKRNRLYHAFRELGRAVRTAFLLRYIADPELRATIQAAVTKSEQFNEFKDWVAFGGDVINSNDRDEQRKRIKYNHLAANCVIFYTACQLTQVVKELLAEGHSISREALTGISPYLTEHINRLGNYTLKLERVLEVDYDFKLPD